MNKGIIQAMVVGIILISILVIASIDLGSKTVPLNKETFISEFAVKGNSIQICDDKIYLKKNKVFCWSRWYSQTKIEYLKAEYELDVPLKMCIESCLNTQ